MGFFRNMLFQLMRLCAGVVVFLLAMALGVYYFGVDGVVLAKAGARGGSPERAAQVYLDSSRTSVALYIARCTGDLERVSKEAEEVYAHKPKWRAAGGDEPFFEAFYSSLGSADSKASSGGFYEILALGESRKKLLEFLMQSDAQIVKKILSLREMNSVMLPAVHTSAGAPLEVAILTISLLTQSGDLNAALLRDLSGVADLAKDGDTLEFEKFSVAVLSLSKTLDWTQLRTLVGSFSSVRQAYEFSRLVSRAPDDECAMALISCAYIGVDSDSLCAYLTGKPVEYWTSLRFALLHGEDAVKFLIKQDKPLYRNSPLLAFIAEPTGLMRDALRLDTLCVGAPSAALTLKTILILLAGYLIVRGSFKFFSRRRDTPSWHSPLALARGLFEACIFAIAVFAMSEPYAFSSSKVEDSTSQISFTFEKALNSIKEDTMNFQMDTTTLTAMCTFFAVQLIIYIVCLIKLSAVRRSGLSAKVKLDLLNNETDLFDLGLYMGLWGTVLSLVMLTMGIIQASLMTAYTSTLFGILFTAVLKIAHVRGYRKTLIIEVARGEG